MRRLIQRLAVIIFLLNSACLAEANISNSYQGTTKSLCGLYLKGAIGALLPSNKFKEEGPYLEKRPEGNPIYILGIGYKFNKFFRTDLTTEYSSLKYEASDLDVGTALAQRVKLFNIMVNGYFDFYTGRIFTPYAVVGLGYSRSNAKDLIDSELDITYSGNNKNNFAWNVGLGSKITLSKNIDFDITYKYADFGKISINDVTSGLLGATQKIKAHLITGGVIINL